MPLSAASKRYTSPRGFLVHKSLHACARPASQQPAEFTHQPASSRIHACARQAGFMHARARPASKQDSCMRARGQPASSRIHACARAASIQRQSCILARGQPTSRMHACARAARKHDSCMIPDAMHRRSLCALSVIFNKFLVNSHARALSALSSDYCPKP